MIRIPAWVLAVVILLQGYHTLYSQKESPPQGYGELTPLSESDSIQLVNLPLLTLPQWLKGPDAPSLPHIVDNSVHMYWRPVFAQVGYECGQAAGIGLGFNYAINRLRDLPSNIPQNQYTAHFTWNWGNGGNGWYGVSYFHSFEIVRTLGTPTVEVYGGMSAGGGQRWMSGYDNYYHSMHNRISEVYKIDLSTEEGIHTLRNWLHNNLDGSSVGGVANFYTNAPYGMQTLPPDTPEAGKYVVTSWSSANHALTISGYHDSIRWDYNNDGQYTNDIDINNDGVVDVKDWEIGGFRFANTYSGGPSFGNNGFSYMTYRSCAVPYGSGGIWDNAAHVVYAKANTEPLLTAKITIEYNCRNRIRVLMGVSANQTSTTPDFIIGFPILDYQGGCFFMQGGTTEADKILEFGLDLTPLLNFIGTGTPARYFLLVDEKDPEGWGSGQIISYSVMDYTNGVTEISSNQSNVPINQNSQTKLWVDHTAVYTPVNIISDTLPAATVYEPYTAPLSAQGGTQPYLWEYDLNFTEMYSSGPFPMVNTQQLTPGNNNDGYATKTLDFAFPFFDNEYSQVRVHVDGYITFENLMTWPYLVYEFLKFTKNKYISPFHGDLRLYPDQGDGIWYTGDQNSATFRWKASINAYPTTSELNFAVQLFSNGNIRFYYGNNVYPSFNWLSGMSAGNNKFYQFTSFSNKPSVPADQIIDFEATVYPEGFEILRIGEIKGTAQQTYNNLPVKLRVTDQNNLQDSKLVFFSTDGTNFLVIQDVSVLAGDDGIIEAGETVYLTLDIESLGAEVISNAEMMITANDVYITLTDSLEFLGTFLPGELKTFLSAFTFTAGNGVPDNYNLVFNTMINDDLGNEWMSHITLKARAPVLEPSSVVVNDGNNGSLDPDETSDLVVSLANIGGAAAHNVSITLSSTDPNIVINEGEAFLIQLGAGNTDEIVFNVTAGSNIPVGYIALFQLDMVAGNGYFFTKNFMIVCGLHFEGFETGDFSAYPWTMGGNAEWLIDNNIFYEGAYSARSGGINHSQLSFMEVELFVLNAGHISFYRKVSSENNYDFLRFSIDGMEKGAWSGDQDWSQFTYPVTPGLRTFRWTYEKDYSVVSGSDCAWVDYIVVPSYGDQYPQLVYDPDTYVIMLDAFESVQDTLSILNAGTGPLMFTLTTADSVGNPVSWIAFDYAMGGINPGYQNLITVTFDPSDLEEGLYYADIVITDHIGNEYLIPSWLYVDIATGITEQPVADHVLVVPNPFNQTTSIQFSLVSDANVTIDIFNAAGERIRTLACSSPLHAGNHRVQWDATNEQGFSCNSGLYFYRLRAGNDIVTGKLILMR
jgi:hypothetical protein